MAGGERLPGAPRKGVEWAPGTKDGPPRMGPSTRRMSPRGARGQPEPGWTPYIIGFCVLCIGPLRPLMWDVLKLLWHAIMPAAVTEEEEVIAWYDQDDES